MGYAPEEMTTDPKCWPERLHPEDAPRVFDELPPLIEQGGGTVAYRFRHRDGHYIWIQDTFKVVYDEAGQPWSWSAPGPTSPSASKPSRTRSRPTSSCRRRSSI